MGMVSTLSYPRINRRANPVIRNYRQSIRETLSVPQKVSGNTRVERIMILLAESGIIYCISGVGPILYPPIDEFHSEDVRSRRRYWSPH